MEFALEYADNWFQLYGSEPTSALKLGGDSPEEPLSIEQVALLVERLQERPDLAYLGGPDHLFVFNLTTPS